MVRRLFPTIVIVLVLPLYLLSLSESVSKRKDLPQNGGISYVIPSSILKITALDFHGLTADFLLLKAMTFYGGTVERNERPRVKPWEWRWMYDVLNAATDLDPYFFDPYYFVNSNFTWDARLVRETNLLLAKGERYRDWDWSIPFFMGFNEFYFLKNNAKASEYFMQAAQRPDADPIAASLAARMAYRANRTEIAIAFLKENLKKCRVKGECKDLSKRLAVLQSILILENAAGAYKAKFGKLPQDLHGLLSQRFRAEIPKDPYGGEFYIEDDGSVKTTSDLYPMKKGQGK